MPEREVRFGNGGIDPDTKRIILVGKLSVVTYFFCFAAAAFGYDRDQAFSWAETLYRRMFPRSAERMTYGGGLVLKCANNN